MPPDPARSLRPRMTLRQISILVCLVAVALAVLRTIRGQTLEPWSLALHAAMELPYVLLLPILFLVRRGPLKNAIVSALCAVPLVAFLIYTNSIAASRRFAPILYVNNVSPAIYVLVGIADLLLLAGLIYLGRRVIPSFCPICGRPAMLPDPSVPRSRDFPPRSPARTCLACGSRFRRSGRDPWIDVDRLVRPRSLEILPR